MDDAALGSQPMVEGGHQPTAIVDAASSHSANDTNRTEEVAFAIGAAPISLINGERLIFSLIEHSIGVRKRTLGVMDFQTSDMEG